MLLGAVLADDSLALRWAAGTRPGHFPQLCAEACSIQQRLGGQEMVLLGDTEHVLTSIDCDILYLYIWNALEYLGTV